MTQPSFSSFDAALIVRDAQGQNLSARRLTRFRKPTSCHRAWVYPREVLKEALRLNAAAVIQAHNHLNRNPKPDSADIVLNQRIKEAPDSWRSHCTGSHLRGWGRNCVVCRTRLAVSWLRLLFSNLKLLLRSVALHIIKRARILYGFVILRI